MEKYYIGIDVGGMSLKGGLLDSKGNILYRKVITSNDRKGNKFIVDSLKEIINEIREKNKDKDILGIGIGLPGLIDSKTGIMESAHNLGIDNLNLYEELKVYNLKIVASNDANCAALGEVKFGAAKGYNHAILLTLGTGIGGGVIIDGKLFEGVQSKGTELGHMIINFDGQDCNCGLTGCFETYASATGLIRLTKEIMLENKDSLMWKFVNNDIEKVNGLTSFECAKKNDKAANEVIDKYISYLGIGVLNFCNIFRPEVILIGGGISYQGDYLINKIVKYVEDRYYGMKFAPKVEIKCASLRNDAGIIGAASLVM